jgi:hypothetical protein
MKQAFAVYHTITNKYFRPIRKTKIDEGCVQPL